MLSDEQQKARALKISSVYPTPVNRSTKKEPQIEVFKLRPTILAAFLFSIPLFSANTLYNFYTLGKYTSTADVQAASIMFILMLFALLVVFIVCFRCSSNILYANYSGSSVIFWLSFVATFTIVPFLRVFLSGQSGQGIIELILRNSIFLIASIIVTSFIFILITKIVLKYSNKR
jgi:hypothetical protein